MLTNDVGCAVTEGKKKQKKKQLDQPVSLLIIPIPDPAILSISGPISNLDIGVLQR